MLARSKIGYIGVLAALAVLSPMPITLIATAQCSPRFEVDLIQPQSCGIFDPAITVWGISSTGDLCGTRSGCGDTDGGPFAWFGQPPIIDIPEPVAYPLASAYGVNSGHQVVGSMHSTGNAARRAFLYENGITTDLGTLPLHSEAEAFGINDASIACGYAQSFSGQKAVIWNSRTITELKLPLGPHSVAIDISNNGLVCGWMGEADVTTSSAFVYDVKSGSTFDVGTPLQNTTNAQATGVNSFGSVCGRSWVPCTPSCGVWKGFFWSNGIGYALGALPSFPRCTPRGLNDMNTVIGFCSTSTGVARAFVWQDGVMLALNDLVPAELNLNIQIADGINNAGQIGASGHYNGGGAYVALRLNPIPPQPGDCTCDWLVNSEDLMAVIRNWGECPPEFTAPCTADLNDDHRVNVPDLLMVINHWGQGQGLP